MAESLDTFDLDSYASKYVGHGRISRLSFIANKSPELEAHALQLLAKEAKFGKDTELYVTTMKRLQELGIESEDGKIVEIDEKWVANVDEAGATVFKKLKAEIATHRTEQIKEPIRMGNNELGDFFFERGQYEDAFRSYARTKDYCTTPVHLIQRHFNIIRVQIALGKFAEVGHQVARAEHTPEVVKDEVVMAKLNCFAGLAAMVLGSYKKAALKFTSAVEDKGKVLMDARTGVSTGLTVSAGATTTLDPDRGDTGGAEGLRGGLGAAPLGLAPEPRTASPLTGAVPAPATVAPAVSTTATSSSSASTSDSGIHERLRKELGDVMALDDIAIYGGLCGLATFDRTELVQHVMEKKGFREFLEQVPEVREMIYSFHNCEYTNCLLYLERLKPDLELDIFISGHVKALCEEIRCKALIQYCTPYVAVDLNVMAKAFNQDAKSITDEVSKLIAEKKIPARIDTLKQVLHRKRADVKNRTLTNAVVQGQSMILEVTRDLASV